jgi:hypothetical protein
MTPPAPAACIGPFKLTRLLGGGATGDVYLAERSEDFTQRVAIKIFHLGGSQESAVASAHEKRMLVSLDHPNIVTLLDHGVLPTGADYLVMEFVEGLPIDEFCERHRLEARGRVRLLAKVLDAVAHAHRHLVVHADLKPANILVTLEGEPKLLDFGVATRLEAIVRGAAGTATLGYTPLFSSPEQRSGDLITVASDIYTVGVIARGLLAAQPMSRGAAKDWSAILAKATAPQPADRYTSVTALQADLAHFLAGEPVAARQIPTLESARRWVSRHRWAATLATAIGVTILASIGGVFWNAAEAQLQRGIVRGQLHDLVRLTGDLEGELYDSVGSLGESTDAKKVLVQGATRTLAALSAQDDGDAILTRELAQQYQKLAQLQSASSPEDAAADRARAAALLQRVGN